ECAGDHDATDRPTGGSDAARRIRGRESVRRRRRRLRFFSGGTRRRGRRGRGHRGRGRKSPAGARGAPGRKRAHVRRLSMQAHADPLRIALQVGLYIFFFILTSWLFVLAGLGTVFGIWIGSALGTFVGAVVANVVTLRIYEGRRLADIGFHWNRASAHNLLWGLAGGIAAACIVLAGPLAFRLANLQPGSGVEGPVGTFVFVTVILIFGAAGEE